jgi:UDP-glucose 4-epimerase
MNILVLGGTGFLGGCLCRELLAAGHAVRVLERTSSAPPERAPSAIEYVSGDFADAVALSAAVEGCDVVFHLISTTLPKTSNDNPVYDLQSNLLDTVRLLDIARSSGVRKIIFASSGGTVYGKPQATPIAEGHPTEPECSYGIAKLAIEKYLQLYEHLYGLSYQVLRIANPYGEGQAPTRQQGAIAVFLNKALRGEAITVWGDGSVVRDYVYVEDVARAFRHALAYDGPERIFNIGSGGGHSVNEILNTIESLTQLPLHIDYVEPRAFDVPVNVLDIGRAGRELDWAPAVPLEEGLRRTLAWLEAGRPGITE